MIHKCPICNGKGVVPPKFYPDQADGDKWVQCRGCQGRGLIREVTLAPIPQPSYPPYGHFLTWCDNPFRTGSVSVSPGNQCELSSYMGSRGNF